MNVDFKLYAIATSSFGNMPCEHTFLDVPGYNFNCFGHGVTNSMNDPTTRFVRSSPGSATWAKKLYGNYENSQDCGLPTGLSIRFDGVCQNVANRLLVLTKDGIDTRLTKGNLATILMYGLFGFNADNYIEMVKSTGAELVAAGEIEESDIQTVVKRIEYGQTAAAELEILHEDIPEQLGQPAVPPLAQSQLDSGSSIYLDYQNERAAVFAKLAPQGAKQIAENSLKAGLVAPLEKCFFRLTAALSDDGFQAFFGVSPVIVKTLLLKNFGM